MYSQINEERMDNSISGTNKLATWEKKGVSS